MRERGAGNRSCAPTARLGRAGRQRDGRIDIFRCKGGAVVPGRATARRDRGRPRQPARQLTGIILDDGETTVYTVEGNVNGAGTALEWLRSELGIEDLDSRQPQWLAAAGEPPLFLNGIAGLGGPFWKPDFDSRFVGTGEPWQKAVAVIESIAFLLQANIDEMAKYVLPPARIRVSGGVSQIDGLCRRLAGLARLPVHRREDAEATARGIGYLAAGRPDSWSQVAEERIFAPADDAGISARYRRWRALMSEATGV